MDGQAAIAPCPVAQFAIAEQVVQGKAFAFGVVGGLTRGAIHAGQVQGKGALPDVKSLRIPLKYLANLLTAGDEAPVARALERMLAMRAFQRGRHVDGVENHAVLEQTGLTVAQVEEMYQIMAIANYEDRFVIPTAHREYAEDAFDLRGGCGFSFGNGCSDGQSEESLFGGKK